VKVSKFFRIVQRISHGEIPEINKVVELEENELRRYIDIVIREVKKGERTPDF
jgi:hypothetical protein